MYTRRHIDDSTQCEIQHIAAQLDVQWTLLILNTSVHRFLCNDCVRLLFVFVPVKDKQPTSVAEQAIDMKLQRNIVRTCCITSDTGGADRTLNNYSMHT
jgi:hypothetical protein